MSNLYQKIIFNLLDKNQIVMDRQGYKTFFEEALLDSEINGVVDGEDEICDIFSEDRDRDEVVGLLTDLEQMFFTLGFKSAIKFIGNFEK